MFKTPSTLIILASLLIAGFIPQTTRAQVSNPVYADDVIPVIRITIDPDSLAEILDPANAESDHEFPARFIFDNGAILDTLENVGFRLRGNTSRYSRKKSFKVSFNTFERGRKYYGFEKLNINGEHNDPSIIRSKLCWDMFNELGLVSSRANHVRLYVNEVYYGLYINVEHIDENFLRDRYGNNNGNLYKCLWPADLEYLGGNPDLYKFMSGNRRTYELKTNTDRDDYTDLAFLIANLRFIPDSLMTEFEKIFNVDDFLRVLAVDVAIGNWDNYWFNKNNFYLYNNPESGVFDYLPYDLDNTFGIDWVGPDWGNRDIYAWGHDSEARRLVSKILAVQEYRDRYSYYLNKLVNSLFLPAVMFPGIDAIHTMITPAAAEDTVRTLDYGYTLDDFNNSYDLPLGGHVEYGLKPYIITRRNAILAQLQLNDIPPIVKNVRFAPENARTNQPISVRVFVEDEDPNPAVEVQYEINGLPQTPVLLFDDGLHQDGQAGDLVYGGRIPAVSDTGTVRFFISASDGGGRQSTLP
nr:CotH kinase family protein [Calditrichia bacterium]